MNDTTTTTDGRGGEASMSHEIHGPGNFDDTTNKKFVVTRDGDFIRTEDAYGHKHIRTWKTRKGAEKFVKANS